MADQENRRVWYRQWLLDFCRLPGHHPFPCLLKISVPSQWRYSCYGRSRRWDSSKTIFLRTDNPAYWDAYQHVWLDVQSYYFMLNEYKERLLLWDLSLRVHFCIWWTELHREDTKEIWKVWCKVKPLGQNCVYDRTQKEFISLRVDFWYDLCVWRNIK